MRDSNLSVLTHADVLEAWGRAAAKASTREVLRKGSVSSPGLPVAPHPIKPRAPRTPSPFDPVEGVKKPGTPYEFKPIRLGDLYQLHQQDSYPIAPQRSTKVMSGASTSSAKTATAESPIRRLLTSIARLKTGYRAPSAIRYVAQF
jgi:hypothetical protein